MRNPAGFTFECYPEGRTVEGETFMCGHCNRHTAVKPFQRPEDIGGHCRNCWELLCPSCVDKITHGASCVPLGEWVARIEDQWSRRTQ